MINYSKAPVFFAILLALLILPVFESAYASPLNDGGIIRGVIRNEFGEPLPAGKVVFYKDPAHKIDSVSVSTQGQFEARLETGSYYVAASSYNYCNQLFPGVYLFTFAQKVEVNPDQVKYIEFHLMPGGMVAGLIFTGIEEATDFTVTAVKVDQPDEGWSVSRHFAVSYTGDYVLDGLLTGYYRVFVRGEEYRTVFYPDVYTIEEAEMIEVFEGEVSDDIDFEMDQPGSGTITGSVTDISTGQPLQGAEISAYQWQYLEEDPNNIVTFTNDQGEFDLEVTSGYYFITAAVLPGIYSGNVVRIYYDSRFDPILASAVYVGPHQGVSGIDFDVDLSRNYNLSIAGSLTDSDSEMPIRGADIKAIDYFTGEPLSTGVSQSDGGFLIEHLMSGTYLLEIGGNNIVPTFWPNALGWQQAEAVEISNSNQVLHNGGAITQDYGTPGFSIRGQVSGSDSPLSDVRVYAINNDNGTVSYGITDASGDYQIVDGLYEGTYLIFADLYGWNGEFYPHTIHLDLIYNPSVDDVDIVLTRDPVSVDNRENLPKELALGGNYPNPFNSRTVIVFSADKYMQTQIEIYNIAGQLVNEIRVSAKPGLNSVSWSGESRSGSVMASGVYFYKLAETAEVRKMILLK